MICNKSQMLQQCPEVIYFTPDSFNKHSKDTGGAFAKLLSSHRCIENKCPTETKGHHQTNHFSRIKF